MDKKEWHELGSRTKAVRLEILNLISSTSGKQPKSITKHLVNAVSDLDRFRNAAEERMFMKDSNADLSIFYGQDQTQSDKKSR